MCASAGPSGILRAVSDEQLQSKLSITAEQREKYREAIKAAGAWTPCSRCGADPDSFGVFPARHPVQLFHLHEAISGVSEAHMLTIPLLCTRCGAVYFHATNVLNVVYGETIADD